MNKVKRHPEIFMFGAIAAIYAICTAPDLTWMNVNTDGFYFFTGAAYLTDWYTQPLYKLLGHLALMFPYGAEGWKLAFFLSTLPAIATSILIFYTVRKQTSNKYAPYIGSLVFAGSVIVVSQASVQEVYSLTTFFLIGSYAALVRNRSRMGMLMLGLAYLSYWIIAIPAMVILALWKRRLVKWNVFIMLPFILFVPLATRILSYDMYAYWTSLGGFLFAIRLSDISSRLIDTARLTTVALGLALIPIYYYLRSKTSNAIVLLLIAGVPLLHLLTSPTNESYVQTYVTVAFLALAAGLGVEKLRAQHLKKAVLVCAIVLLVLMPIRWPVGKLDETPTTARHWLNQLNDVPDDAVIVCARYVEWEGELRGDTIGALNRSGVKIHNNETGRSLSYLFPTHYLMWNDDFGERARLRDEGYATPMPIYVGGYWESEEATIHAFAKANPYVKVYYTLVAVPEVQKCELVELK